MSVRRQLLLVLIVVSALSAFGTRAPDLVADAGERVRVGDVFHVRGKSAFMRGARYSFFVGGVYASWRRVDDHTAVVVVPAGVDQGAQWLSFAPSLTSDHTAAVGITRFEVQREECRTIAAATARLPAAGVSALSAGLIRVGGRGVGQTASVTVRQIRADAERAFFRSTMIAGFDLPNPPLPPFSFDDVFAIDSAQAADIVAVTVTVPAEWLRTIPAGFEPELYAYAEEQGANDEVIPRVDALRAQWTASSRRLHAAPAPLRAAAHQELTIYLGIRKKVR